jgi:hypothetical protein
MTQSNKSPRMPTERMPHVRDRVHRYRCGDRTILNYTDRSRDWLIAPLPKAAQIASSGRSICTTTTRAAAICRMKIGRCTILPLHRPLRPLVYARRLPDSLLDAVFATAWSFTAASTWELPCGSCVRRAAVGTGGRGRARPCSAASSSHPDLARARTAPRTP